MEHLRPPPRPESPPETAGRRAGRAEPGVVRALVSDYDGTLASHGRVEPATIAALRRLRASGRKLVLVTGRQLPDLLQVFPPIELLDRAVLENGALLYDPSDRSEELLADPPPHELVAELERRGVSPLSVGRVVVATHEPHAELVRRTIRELGLSLHLILNKGAVMVLPTGVDKGTGMSAALLELGILPATCVGIGDAENDLAFMARCGYAIAVANALESVRQQADLITAGSAGAGIVEVVDRLLGIPGFS